MLSCFSWLYNSIECLCWINGEKKALLTGLALFGLVSLAIFFAESAEFVIAIRFLLGIAGALLMPTTLSMIRVIFENPKERATALSCMVNRFIDRCCFWTNYRRSFT